MTPAEEIRAAAYTLRGVADGTTPGPWRFHDTHLPIGGHTATVLAGEGFATELVAWLPSRSNEPWANHPCWKNSQWMATVHPGLADPLASWLEACARNADHMTHDTDWGICDEPASVQAALAVARAINGEA